MHEKTVGHLSEWYKRSFQQVGWVFLSVAKGHHEYRDKFVSELDMLRVALKEKMGKIKESRDLSRDLLIMHDNVVEIHKIVRDHRVKRSDLVNYQKGEHEEKMTRHSIARHYKRIFQMVGWSLLAVSRGHASKMKCMFDSASHLHSIINKNIDHVINVDTRRDFEIMREDIETLLSIVFTSPQSKRRGEMQKVAVMRSPSTSLSSPAPPSPTRRKTMMSPNKRQANI